MGFLGWIVLGLLAGAIAKAIMPKLALGWVGTTVLGIVGALVGGFIGRTVFKTDIGQFFEIRTWLLAILGSVIVIWVVAALTGRSRA